MFGQHDGDVHVALPAGQKEGTAALFGTTLDVGVARDEQLCQFREPLLCRQGQRALSEAQGVWGCGVWVGEGGGVCEGEVCEGGGVCEGEVCECGMCDATLPTSPGSSPATGERGGRVAAIVQQQPHNLHMVLSASLQYTHIITHSHSHTHTKPHPQTWKRGVMPVLVRQSLLAS